ncbi:MAG: hypothetical protein ACK2UT_00275 [Candidatus Promineifilaceae bacterium]
MANRDRSSLLVIFILLAITLFALVNSVRGQDGAAAAPQSVQGQLTAGFTFQGQLQDTGAPVDGACDLRASLWDAAENGTQIGEVQTIENVPIKNGRFTITLNANDEFGAAPFSGQQLWLEIAVRCPAASGSYTTLKPRQLLTAAPYAYGLVPGARMVNDYANRWGMEVIVPGSEPYGGIYAQMGNLIDTGVQAAIRADSTTGPAILGQTDDYIGVMGVSEYASAGYAGYFYGNLAISGKCYGCTQAQFAVNHGRATLREGDLVTIDNVVPAAYANAPLLWQVRTAQEGDPVVGVVHAAARIEKDPAVDEDMLMPGENSAAPGDTLSIIVFGPAPVRLDTAAGALKAGTRLTAGTNGKARSLQTVTADGVTFSETGPSLGIILENGDSDGDGLVWVLVNPQ